MVLRPQAKKSNRYDQKVFSKKNYIFNRHLLLDKKVTHPRRGALGICTGFLFSVVQAAVISNFSMLKLLAKDKLFNPGMLNTIIACTII